MRLKALLLLAIVSFLPTCYGGVVTGTIQGPSGLPVRNATLGFQLQQAGLAVGTGLIVPTNANCYTDQSGNVVGLPNPPLAPVVTTTTGSGLLPGGTYYITQTFIAATGETSTSPEFRIQLTGTGSLLISAPITVPANATGVRNYVGTASGTETLQGVGATTGVFTLGTPLTAGVAAPTTNTVACSIIFNDQIIPVTGYNVSLTSANGNSYPGWPQAWQLNSGSNGTVNVSQGAPLFNGTVVYPTPILSQPLNHGPQSISGPLDFGGYNVTNMGTSTAASMNGVVNANLQAGVDIGAKVNTGLLTCNSDCTVKVPAGSYTFSTPIVLPMNLLGTLTLEMDDGAALNYSGTGCAITGSINTGSPTVTNLRIRGGQLFGNANALCGIHINPSNSVSISGMLIYGFSTGYGVWVDGANGVNIFDDRILNNRVGVYATPTFCSGNTCSPTTPGSGYTPNAVWIHHDVITGNSNWGILFYDVVTGALTGALNDVIADNDLELNGSAGTTFGAGKVGRSSSLVVEGNYFEGSPREVVLGFPGSPGAYFGSYGPVVRDNHFTLLNTTPYEIELQDTTDALIEGNSTLGASIQPTGACFLNETQTVGTFFGKNHVITGASGSTGTVSPLCQAGSPELALAGTGSYSAVNTNYLMRAVNVNYAITSAGTSETVAVGGNITAASQCTVGPFNAAANATAQASSYIATGVNTGTLYHPSSVVGQEVTIFCAPGPFN